MVSLLFALATILIIAACGNGNGSGNNGTTHDTTSHYVDIDFNEEVDWSLFPIIIDGQRGVTANWHTAEGEDFPTHIPLIPVAAALGAIVDAAYTFPPEVTMQGLLGQITFTVGSYDFYVNGNEVELWQPSLLVDGDIYVPIAFFRDIYGMGQAMWMGGHVYLDTEASNDMY